MKNRKLILILSLVLALTMSLGGTLAYLTDTDADVNTMVLGNVQIVQNEQQWNDDKSELEEFEQDKPLLPYVGELGWENKDDQGGAYRRFTMNNVVDKYVTVTNKGNTNAYVRTIIAVEMGGYTTEAEYRNKIVGFSRNVLDGDEFKFDGAWEWDPFYVATIDSQNYLIMTATHKNPVAAKTTTIPSLLQVYVNKDCDNEQLIKLDGNKNGKLDILVISQAVQANGFENASAALNEAFSYGTDKAATVAGWFESIGEPNSKYQIGSPDGEKNDTNNPPVIAEITVDSVDALIKAVKDGYTVIGLADGEYDLAGLTNVNGITLIGSKNAVITVKNEGELGVDYGVRGSTFTFEGLTFDTTGQSGTYRGFAGLNATYNKCNFVGTYTLYGVSEFNNCTFDLRNNYVWTWGASKVDFNNCVFEDTNGMAKAILVHGDTDADVTVNNCTFKATTPAKTWDGIAVAAVSIDPYTTKSTPPAASDTYYTINFVGENTVSDVFNGLVQVKYAVEEEFVTINQ